MDMHLTKSRYLTGQHCSKKLWLSTHRYELGEYVKSFAATIGDEEDTFILCYTADFEIDLQKHAEFKKALEFSSNLVEVVIGFKKDGKVLEDCFEENANRQAELQPSE